MVFCLLYYLVLGNVAQTIVLFSNVELEIFPSTNAGQGPFLFKMLQLTLLNLNGLYFLVSCNASGGYILDHIVYGRYHL